MTKHHIGITLLVMLMLALFGACPVSQAYAESAHGYSISNVSIDATVNKDGSLSVTEDRTFDFDGTANGVYWDIPNGEYNNRDVSVAVTSMGTVSDDGTFTRYACADSADKGDSGIYTTKDQNKSGVDVLRTAIYSPQDRTKTTFRVEYVLYGVTSDWSDTGELYWKFVSDGWDVASQNVTCTIHLPVPDGTSVTPGDNVKAWGHGPTSGNVSFVDGDVVLSVPSVGTDEYAEARIAFPTSWLADMEPSSEPKLDEITSQETDAAGSDASGFVSSSDDLTGHDTDKIRGMAENTIGTMFIGVLSVLSVILLVIFLLNRFMSRVTGETTSKKTTPDLPVMPPTDVNPAVLGVLYNHGKVTTRCLMAALMSLSGTDSVTTSSMCHSIVLVVKDGVPTPSDKVDAAALSFVRECAKIAGTGNVLDTNWLQELEDSHHDEYGAATSKLSSAISDAASKLGYDASNLSAGAARTRDNLVAFQEWMNVNKSDVNRTLTDAEWGHALATAVAIGTASYCISDTSEMLGKKIHGSSDSESTACCASVAPIWWFLWCRSESMLHSSTLSVSADQDVVPPLVDRHDAYDGGGSGGSFSSCGGCGFGGGGGGGAF